MPLSSEVDGSQDPDVFLKYALSNLLFHVSTGLSRERLFSLTFNVKVGYFSWWFLSGSLDYVKPPHDQLPTTKKGSQPQWGHVEIEGLSLEHMVYHSPAVVTPGKTNPLPGLLIISNSRCTCHWPLYSSFLLILLVSFFFVTSTELFI